MIAERDFEYTYKKPDLQLKAMDNNREVIKAHGSSNAEAIDNAIGQARQVAESGIIGQIQENVHLMQVQPE